MDINKTEKVRIKIPVDKANEKDTTADVGINGHFWRIKRGVEVTVPTAVYELLDKAGYNPSMLGAVKSNKADDVFACEFCGKEAKNAAGLSAHVAHCEKNPNSPKYTD